MSGNHWSQQEEIAQQNYFDRGGYCDSAHAPMINWPAVHIEREVPNQRLLTWEWTFILHRKTAPSKQQRLPLSGWVRFFQERRRESLSHVRLSLISQTDVRTAYLTEWWHFWEGLIWNSHEATISDSWNQMLEEGGSIQNGSRENIVLFAEKTRIHILVVQFLWMAMLLLLLKSDGHAELLASDTKVPEPKKNKASLLFTKWRWLAKAEEWAGENNNWLKIDKNLQIASSYGWWCWTISYTTVQMMNQGEMLITS